MSLRLRPVLAVVLRQLYLLRSSPVRVAGNLAWGLIDIVLWGFLTHYLNEVSASGLDFVPRLLGSVLLWDFFMRVMQGVSIAFLEDIWQRNLLNLFISPISLLELLAGLVLSSLLTSALGLLVMLLVASAGFGLSLWPLGAEAAVFVLVLYLFGTALGIVAIAVLLRFGPAAEWIVWPLPALLAPFVGVYYPINTLPAWMRTIGSTLPPTYVYENLRTLIGGSPARGSDLLVAGGLALLYVALAGATLDFVQTRTRRSGQLARYAAEGM